LFERVCLIASSGNQPINQSISLFVLNLGKEKNTISMKILKLKIRVLAAWNNHNQAAS